MRVRQMGFSSRLKVHKNILTLETLKFIAEYLIDQNARQGAWLKKHPMVIKALDRDLDEQDIKQLHRSLNKINAEMEACKQLLGLNEI